MKKMFLLTTILLSVVCASAQKISSVESGNLKICDLTSSNYTTNCSNVDYGVSIASIGNHKIAIVYNSGQLKVCDITSSNYLTNCSTIESYGVSNAQMSGDGRIIITYDNGSKKACDITSSNYTTNCSSL